MHPLAISLNTSNPKNNKTPNMSINALKPASVGMPMDTPHEQWLMARMSLRDDLNTNNPRCFPQRKQDYDPQIGNKVQHWPVSTFLHKPISPIYTDSVDAYGRQIYAPSGEASVRGFNKRPYEQTGIHSAYWQQDPSKENYASFDSLGRLAHSRGIIPSTCRSVPIPRTVTPHIETSTGLPGIEEWERRWHRHARTQCQIRPYQYYGFKQA